MNFFKEEKRLEEKAWKEMAELLDKEMPVGQKRQRRPFAWLFMGLAVFSAISIGYVWGKSDAYKGDKPSPVESSSKKHAAIQSQQYSVQADESFAAAAGNAGNYFKNMLTWSYRPLKQYVFVPVSGRAENYPTEPMSGGDSTESGAMLSINSPELVESTAEEMLDVKDFDKVTKITQKAKRDYRRLHYGLSSGVSTEGWDEVDGYSAGATIDWNFAKHWGLRSGAAYCRYSPTIESQPLVKVYDWDYMAATGNTVVSQDNQPWGTGLNQDPYVIIPVNKIHKIEMPVLMYWQPLKNLKALAGLNVGYIVYGQSASHNFSDDRVLRIAIPALEKQVSKLATEELHQWQTGAVTGISYRPLKFLEIGATYNRLIDLKTLSTSFNQQGSNSNLAKYSEMNFGGVYRPQQIFTFNTTLFF